MRRIAWRLAYGAGESAVFAAASRRHLPRRIIAGLATTSTALASACRHGAREDGAAASSTDGWEAGVIKTLSLLGAGAALPVCHTCSARENQGGRATHLYLVILLRLCSSCCEDDDAYRGERRLTRRYGARGAARHGIAQSRRWRVAPAAAFAARQRRSHLPLRTNAFALAHWRQRK